MKEQITASEAARRLGMSRAYLARLCAAGRILGAHKVGPVWVIGPGAFITPKLAGRPRIRIGVIHHESSEVDKGMSRAYLARLCAAGRIPGAHKVGPVWVMAPGAFITPKLAGRPRIRIGVIHHESSEVDK